jgi:hypothetical protein
MMMGVGFLIMLALLAVPILLVVGLLLLMIKPLIGARGRQAAAGPGPVLLEVGNQACSHCGAALRREWAHCPQCGATV